MAPNEGGAGALALTEMAVLWNAAEPTWSTLRAVFTMTIDSSDSGPLTYDVLVQTEPYRLRVERRGPQPTSLTVDDGTTRWRQTDAKTVDLGGFTADEDHNVRFLGSDLLFPRFIPARWHLEPTAVVTRDGRRALLLHGTWATYPPHRPPGAAPPLNTPSTIDLEVDIDTGIIVRSTRGGNKAAITLQSIDERLPSGAFDFAPPPGTKRSDGKIHIPQRFLPAVVAGLALAAAAEQAATALRWIRKRTPF